MNLISDNRDSLWEKHDFLICTSRRRVCGHIRSAKAQISLCIRAAWSGPSKTKSFDTVEYFNGEQMPGWDFAHVQDDANTHILRMIEGTFSHRAAKMQTLIPVQPAGQRVYVRSRHLVTLLLLNITCPDLSKPCRSRSVSFWRSQLIWNCSFVIQYVNLYQ